MTRFRFLLHLGLALFTTTVVFEYASASEKRRTSSAKEVLVRSAEALGMVRGVQRQLRSVNRVRYTVTGLICGPADDEICPPERVGSAIIAMDYHVNAMRWQVVQTDPSAKETASIRVARGDSAWDEREPGIGAIATDENAAVRLRQLLHTPHGAIRAALDAEDEQDGAVRLQRVDGGQRLAFRRQASQLEVDLNSDYRPARVRMRVLGKDGREQRIVTRFWDYRDWERLEVYFPERIVQEINGRRALDLTVSEFRSNPYVVFPVPAQMGT